MDREQAINEITYKLEQCSWPSFIKVFNALADLDLIPGASMIHLMSDFNDYFRGRPPLDIVTQTSNQGFDPSDKYFYYSREFGDVRSFTDNNSLGYPSVDEEDMAETIVENTLYTGFKPVDKVVNEYLHVG